MRFIRSTGVKTQQTDFRLGGEKVYHRSKLSNRLRIISEKEQKMQVKTTDGIVEGETVNNETCGTYYSFKGIPYAAPPVGNLRFKPPQPLQPWEGVRSAKAHGNICHQFNFLTRQPEKGSEDCLYLNVYTPNIKPAQPLPVMIWIHGGAFVFGSGNDDIFGPDYLIRHGVILVTFNYRLEILGFLCLDTEDIPGNAGIKDQVAAMRWVQKNISNFGGDPNNVTIFGQSAGASSVTYHCVSPMTKGLFKRGIAQSGCLANYWTQGYRLRDRTIALAKKLGCNSEDDKELYEFFRDQPKESLIGILSPLTVAEKYKDKYETQFGVVSEKVFPNVETFFTGDIFDALKNNVHEGVELIIGYNKDDGAFNFGVSHDIKETIFQCNNFKEHFVPKHLSLHCSINDQLDIGDVMKQRYMKKEIASTNNLKPLKEYYDAEVYKFGIHQAAKYFATKNKVYLYKFTCKTERNFFSKISGVAKYVGESELSGHGDDLPYLFPIKSINQTVSKTSQTFKLINNITKLWTNFAKTGNPTPDISLGTSWRVYRSDTQAYLEIGNTLTRATKPDKDELIFWEELYKKYLPSHVFTPEPPKEA